MYFCHKGSFKCYVMLEEVCGYMPKRYEALRGGGGTSVLHNAFFLITLLGLPSCPCIRRGFYDNLASISNNNFVPVHVNNKNRFRH